MKFAFAVLFALAAIVGAHPEAKPVKRTPEELAKREAERLEREELAHECGEAVTHYTMQRKQRRELMARGLIDVDHVVDISHFDKRELAKRQGSATGTAATPHFTAIKTPFSCVQTPEVTEGPYYIKDELVRSDLRDGKAGVTLALDLGVIDIRTCQPVPNVFVEIWASSPDGMYSAFTKADFPRNVSRTDGYNFGRGGHFTNSAGLVELITTYPGYYTSRTLHIHTMVHQGVTVRANGTIKSDPALLRHDGQVFFNDTLTTTISQRPEYKTNQTRTYNAQDSIYQQAMGNRNNAIVDATYLGSNGFDGGLLGYVTMGVDLTARRPIQSFEVYNPNWPNAAPSTPVGPTTTATRPTTSSSGPTSSSPPPGGCSVAKYGQCGGQGYSGCTTCASGATCTFSNTWYSQCL